MIALIARNWALLFGITLLMIGHGLQGTLLSLYTAFAGFSTALAGFVLSGYFVGLLAGSLTARHVIARVGHVRVFAAMASIASTTILGHLLVVEPITWLVLRLITGYCFACIYIVAESWLNAASGNEVRGQLMAVYMVLQTLGFAIGPLLLNLSEPGSFEPFVYVSVSVSLAAVPMLLTAVPTPPPAPTAAFRLRELYATSPLGFVALFGVGVTLGATLSIGPLYGQAMGLDVFEITTLMAMLAVGGAIFQWPFGRLSDRTDRRKTVIAAAVGAAIAMACADLAGRAHPWLLWTCFLLFSGFNYPLYALGVAYINDRLRPEQMVAASSAILLTNGIGASLGPSLGGFALDRFGPVGFTVMVAGVCLAIAAFGIWRMAMRPAIPAGERAPFVPLHVQPTPTTFELAQQAAPPRPDEPQKVAADLL